MRDDHAHRNSSHHRGQDGDYKAVKEDTWPKTPSAAGL